MSDFELPPVPANLEHLDDFQLAARLADEIREQNDKAQSLLFESEAFNGFEEFRKEVEADLAEAQRQTLLRFSELMSEFEDVQIDEYIEELNLYIAEVDESLATKKQELTAKVDAAVEAAIAAVPAQAEKYKQMGEELKARGEEDIVDLSDIRVELTDRLARAGIIKEALQKIKAAPSPELWSQRPKTPEEAETELEAAVQEENEPQEEIEEPEPEQPVEATSEEPEVLAEEPLAPAAAEEELAEVAEHPKLITEPEETEERVEEIQADSSTIAREGIKRAAELGEGTLKYFELIRKAPGRSNTPEEIFDKDMFIKELFPDEITIVPRGNLQSRVDSSLKTTAARGRSIRTELLKEDSDLLQTGFRVLIDEAGKALRRPDRVWRKINVREYNPKEDDGEMQYEGFKVAWEPIDFPPQSEWPGVTEASEQSPEGLEDEEVDPKA
jgi:hypothetical protein